MKVTKEKSWIGVGDGGVVAKEPRLEQSVSLVAPGVGMSENVESEVLERRNCVTSDILCLARFDEALLGVDGLWMICDCCDVTGSVFGRLLQGGYRRL